MFTHQQTLDAINAGLRAVGMGELDGIPRAAPQHSTKCVLGCAFNAALCDYGSTPAARIDFYWADREQRDAILDAWREAGVECEPHFAHSIEFRGGLVEWMREFDGGTWKALIVDGYDAERLDFEEYPGQTVPVSQIEPEYFAEQATPPAAGPHPGCAEFADDRDL